MQARRLLGIERADFNYDMDAEKKEELTAQKKNQRRSSTDLKSALRRKRHFLRNNKALQQQHLTATARRLQKKKLAARQLLLMADRRQKSLQGGVGRGQETATAQPPLDEFNVDNIEALVDNQPVEDENTNDSLVMGEVVGGEGGCLFSCTTSPQIFPSRSGLEYHEQKKEHLKAFSCPTCDLR